MTKVVALEANNSVGSWYQGFKSDQANPKTKALGEFKEFLYWVLAVITFSASYFIDRKNDVEVKEEDEVAPDYQPYSNYKNSDLHKKVQAKLKEYRTKLKERAAEKENRAPGGSTGAFLKAAQDLHNRKKAETEKQQKAVLNAKILAERTADNLANMFEQQVKIFSDCF